VPLTLRLLFTFQRYRGLYFWSILITTWALNARAIGFLLKFTVTTSPWLVSTTLFELGWVGMVSGFSIVLYSRLSILVRNRLILRLTLAMIIINGVCLHTATLILVYGSSIESRDGLENRAKWLAALRAMDGVHAVGFTMQGFVISCLYMKAAWDQLQEPLLPNRGARKVYTLLITVQALVLSFDILVIVLAFAGYYAIKGMVCSFTYSIKLELEFVILNQLVAISRQRIPGLMSIPVDSESGLQRAGTTASTTPLSAKSNEKSTASTQLNLDL
jgi:hypothetical protein